MKPYQLASSICLLLIPITLMAQKKGKKEDNASFILKNQRDSVAYAIGISIATNLKTQGLDSVNADALKIGITDFTYLQKPMMTSDQANAYLNDYFSKCQSKKFEKNKGEGATFLSGNKTKPGVVTTASGLQYLIIKEGTGPIPTANDKVKTHYHGTLIGGKVFDSSVDRGEPITFPVNGVIKGWTEALQLMKVGSKWKLFIPYDLAYGEQGAGGSIEPFSTLIFEVELLAIEK